MEPLPEARLPQPPRWGWWQQVLADALDQNLALGVRAAVADHVGKRPGRIGCRRLALNALAGLTELTMGVERVASNHQGVDFAGPIEDLEGLAVSKQSLHAAAVVDAHGTEDLDRFDGVPHGRVGAE